MDSGPKCTTKRWPANQRQLYENILNNSIEVQQPTIVKSDHRNNKKSVLNKEYRKYSQLMDNDDSEEIASPKKIIRTASPPHSTGNNATFIIAPAIKNCSQSLSETSEDLNTILYAERNSLDISAFVTDRSITLQSSFGLNNKSIDTTADSSFKSIQFAAHSTKDEGNLKRTRMVDISIDEILASSFAEKARRLRGNLYKNNNFESDGVVESQLVRGEKANDGLSLKFEPTVETLRSLNSKSCDFEIPNECTESIISPSQSCPKEIVRNILNSRRRSSSLKNSVKSMGTKNSSKTCEKSKKNCEILREDISTTKHALNQYRNGAFLTPINEPNKENISHQTIKHSNRLEQLQNGVASSVMSSIKSSSTHIHSNNSSNSEMNHHTDQILHLKSTALELSWGSVRLRQKAQKSFQVKNTFTKFLVFRIEVHGPGFQLANLYSNMLPLQSQELRTIVINFQPTVTGAAIGKLIFQSPRQANHKIHSNIIIPLYGYGGHANIAVQHIVKGPVGAPFLPMGELCALVQPLETTFQLYNKGTLTGFAVCCIEPIDLHVPGLSTAFEVFPRCTLIEPQSAITVRLVFQPTREDIKKIQKIIHDVLTLGKLRIIYGDEAMRQRLRQIHCEMQEETRVRCFAKSLDMLWTRLPSERPMYESDIFKERTMGLVEGMWQSLSNKEIALTLNNNLLDETTTAELSNIFTETDENSIFF